MIAALLAFAVRHSRVLIPLGCALALVTALVVAFQRHAASAVAKDRRETEAAARRIDGAADDRAGQAAAAAAARTEQENADARRAAAGSDDPLKSALDRLRAAQAGNRRAAPGAAGVRR